MNLMYSDLNRLQRELNELVSSQNYQQFQEYLNHFLGQNVLVNGNILKLHVWVKPIRKKFLQICSGEKCFSKGFYNSNVKLNKISCCNFHTYCDVCLHDYIYNTLSLNRDVKVGCEGCNKMGVGAPDKYLEEKEMKRYLNEDEFNDCIKTGLKRQYISRCVTGYEHCEFKNSPMLKDQYKNFECCGKICLNCYGTAVENYLRDKIKIIENNPIELHGKNLSIMCIREHGSSSYYPQFHQIEEIIKHSVSPKDNRDILLGKVRKWIHLFQRGIIIFCSNCQKLFMGRDQNKCDSCEKCFRCGQEYHPTINCATFARYLNSDADKGEVLQAIKDINDPNFQQFMKATQILTEMKLNLVKIENFYIVTPSELNKYKTMLLSHGSRNLHEKYLFSKPFDSIDPVDDELSDGITPDNENFYQLSEYSDNEIKYWVQNGIGNEENKSDNEIRNPVIVIVYKVIFEKISKFMQIERMFSREKNDLELFSYNSSFRFSNKYIALPCFILYLNVTV